MNKVKLLIMAGLFSLSSMAHAIAIDPAATGSILLNVGDSATVGSAFQAGSTATVGDEQVSLFYNLGVTADIATAAISSAVNAAGATFAVTLELFEDTNDNDLFDALDMSIAVSANAVGATLMATLIGGADYFLQITGGDRLSHNTTVSTVPVPAAGILFASALLGAGALGRRKKKTADTAVGAFARAN